VEYSSNSPRGSVGPDMNNSVVPRSIIWRRRGNQLAG